MMNDLMVAGSGLSSGHKYTVERLEDVEKLTFAVLRNNDQELSTSRQAFFTFTEPLRVSAQCLRESPLEVATHITLRHRNERLTREAMSLHQSNIKYPTSLKSDFLGRSIHANPRIGPLGTWIGIDDICQSAVFLHFGSGVGLDDHAFFSRSRIRVSLNDLTVWCKVLGRDGFWMNRNQRGLEWVREGVDGIDGFG
jgi:hypothetical protein